MSDQYSPPPASPDEKAAVDKHHQHRDVEGGATPSGRARWFGGRNIYIGGRIGPVLSSLSSNYSSDSDDSSSAILIKQKESEAGAAIQYRTCSWQKVCARPCGSVSAPVWTLWMLMCDVDRGSAVFRIHLPGKTLRPIHN